MPTKKTIIIKTATPPPLPKVKGKLGEMTRLLRRKQGATVAQLIEVTGWQEHSVRGALAGALKKRGFAITSEKEGDVRIYRIADPAAPASAQRPADAAPVQP